MFFFSNSSILFQIKNSIHGIFNNTAELITTILQLFELYMLKMMFIYAFYICLNDVSALQFIVVLLAIAAIASRFRMQLKMYGMISLIMGILVLMKMIYQVHTVRADWGSIICEVSVHFVWRFHKSRLFHFCLPPLQNLITISAKQYLKGNAVHWLGMEKDTQQRPFTQIVMNYEWFLITATIYTLICVHLKRDRYNRGQPLDRPKHIFPDITREQADRGMPNMCKFLVNFFFAKFGIECTFMMVLVLASIRMDLVAIVYVTWLLALFLGDANFKRIVWPYFRVYIIVSILLQYFLTVGIPPFVCIGMIFGRTSDSVVVILYYSYFLVSTRL